MPRDQQPRTDRERPSSDLIAELKQLRRSMRGDRGGYQSAVGLDRPGEEDRIAVLEAILRERGHL